MMKYLPCGISVREAMTLSPVICGPELSVKDAAKLMIKNHVGSLLIAKEDSKDKKLLGIMTEKDILKKLITKGKDPAKVYVRNIMTKNPMVIGKDADIIEALKLMVQNDFRRIPVIEGDKLIGLITEKDIMRIEPHVVECLITKKKIKEINRKPIKVKEVQGMCEECGNFSEELVDKSGMFVCHDCRYSK
ncbi:MAG: CBS domain-containing protein [Candidatus Omnitrophica bacterium]|nr:CBS domain-containing protein [Candidatus Omnitrophota bacterium]